MNQKHNSNNKSIDKFEYVDGEFNINLIKTINQNKTENYLVSPYSIEMALNLLKLGADGNTLKEIDNVIGNRKINDIIIKDRVSVANAAFIKNNYKNYIEESYYHNIKTKFNSEILYDDFRSPKVINDWVNDKTNGMIDKVVDQVDPSFVLGLANALAIDVKWDAPFDCNATRSQRFTKINGKNINVEMMHKTLKYNNSKYLENDLAKGVIIPYKMYDSLTGEEKYTDGRRLEFVAILPNDGVNNYINNLSLSKLNDLEKTAREVDDNFEIKLSLPRFKYDYTLDNFKDVLNDLGMHDAFDEVNADFTKIMPKSIHSDIGNIYVGEAIHKTHIDLNELGTKAAAVTYFGMYTSGMVREVSSVDLVFDRPFIYMIRDSETNEMLFFGVVYEPNKWNGTTCTNDE